MKKLLFLLVSLSICVALSACGDKNSISGEVVEVTPAALILETDEGKQIAVLLEEDTYIAGMGDFDGDSYKASPHTKVKVRVLHDGRAGSLTTSGGTRVKAYRAGTFILIEAYLVSDAAILSDGTKLDAWNSKHFGTTYQTKDNVVLLREYVPSGPENHYVGNLESFDDLSENAKIKVSEFYDKQGKLYDLKEELERAWMAYRAAPETFSTFGVEQYSSPVGASDEVFYFKTALSRTVTENICHETRYCNAFDRENGTVIPLEDLFNCPKEEIGKRLLELAEKEGSIFSDPVVNAEMEDAFRLEYLMISQYGLEIEFPQGTLPSQEYTYMISLKFNTDCKKLLHPWAIPQYKVQ